MSNQIAQFINCSHDVSGVATPAEQATNPGVYWNLDLSLYIYIYK